MEITIETIKEIAKDIIDEQNNDNLQYPYSSQHNNGERLALKMLIRTLEHRQKLDKTKKEVE